MSRVLIGADALRAALGAHRTDTHGGRVGYRCATCSRYMRAVTRAEAHERDLAHPTRAGRP